jgi:protein-S-isoprenylcysteine O-methyltransferase Ste14
MMSRFLLAFGGWLFKYRNRVFPLVLVGLFIVLRPHLLDDDADRDIILDLFGLGLALAGQWLRAMVVGYAYIKRGGLNKQVHADNLVTAGLFAHSRNPLYLGNVMILMGLFVIFNHPIAYLLGGIFFGLGYVAIIHTEEAYLLNKFGAEYRDYCEKVNRWWLRWTGMRDTLAGMEFKWRRVLAKEFASCLTWWLTALALLAYEATSNGNVSVLRLEVLTALAASSVGLFMWSQQAKRAGRLAEPAV